MRRGCGEANEAGVAATHPKLNAAPFAGLRGSAVGVLKAGLCPTIIRCASIGVLVFQYGVEIQCGFIGGNGGSGIFAGVASNRGIGRGVDAVGRSSQVFYVQNTIALTIGLQDSTPARGTSSDAKRVWGSFPLILSASQCKANGANVRRTKRNRI